MSQIRCVYHPATDGTRTVPNFPATDQHPAAVRYAFDHPTRGALNVDAVGGAPTLAEVNVLLGLDAPAQAVAQRIAADAVDVGVCAVDPNVTAFLNMTPAELDAWVDANITGVVAPVRTAFKVLGKLALVGARGRQLR
jgi:hypothetical protein